MNIEPRHAAEMLGKLVACPSVNPNDRPFSGPPFGEKALVELLSGMLREWGAEVSAREVLPGRPNLIALFRGRNSHRSLMFEVHSDTVNVENMTIAPFDPRVEAGCLYGRGACDAKGAMAAMLLGIRAFLESDRQPPVNLYFVSTCNEERGADGARRLMEEGFRVDSAIVGEPTGLTIIHAHNGALRWRIRTHGRAAHSSDPDAGINAIAHMATLVSRLSGPLAEALKHKRHPMLGQPTISVGTIRGGTQVNVIPSLCEIEVDRRILPSEASQEATEELLKELEELKRSQAGFEYSWEQTEWYPPMEHDRESPVAQLVARACQTALGAARFGVVPWCANTGAFKQAGIPCVLFGPGSIRQAHTPDEFIPLDEVVAAARVYAQIIRLSDS